MNWQQQLRRGTSVDGALQYVRNTRESRGERSRVEEKKAVRESRRAHKLACEQINKEKADSEWERRRKEAEQERAKQVDMTGLYKTRGLKALGGEDLREMNRQERLGEADKDAETGGGAGGGAGLQAAEEEEETDDYYGDQAWGEQEGSTVLTSLNHAGVGSDPDWREEWRQQAAWGAEACLCQDVRADAPRWRQLGFAARAAWAVGKVVWQHQGGMQDKHGRPFEEAAMAATGELARRAGSELKDHRGWGRWSGRLFHACDATVAVISVQAPCHSANAGGAWVRQEEELYKQGGGGKGREEKPDPGEVMLQELGKVVGELRSKGIAVVLGGDWNREWGVGRVGEEREEA